MNFFYLSIIVERFTMYNLVVLYLCSYLSKSFPDVQLDVEVEEKVDGQAGEPHHNKDPEEQVPRVCIPLPTWLSNFLKHIDKPSYLKSVTTS